MSRTLKDRLRAELIAARLTVAEQVQNAETRALCGHVRAVLTGTEAVAAYAPLTTEPGFPDLPDALLAASSRVLMPVARASANGTPMPLQWAEYLPEALVDAPFGLSEPERSVATSDRT